MSDLASFQAQFAQALASTAPAAAFARQPGFAIYRNTSLKAALDALAAGYPTVLQLLGTEEFQRLAIDHARRSPPRSPVLADYGIDFPATCAEAAADRPHIADVSRIDRLWTEAHLAADAAPVRAETIAALAPDALMALRLALHPATRHGWFATPAPSIWIAHRNDADLTEIAVDCQPEGLLLTRAANAVIWHRAGDDMIALLKAFESGGPMGTIASDFLSHHPDADLAGLFARLLEAGALIDQTII